MDEEQQRKIVSEGGRAAHEKDTDHESSRETARKAGRKVVDQVFPPAKSTQVLSPVGIFSQDV